MRTLVLTVVLVSAMPVCAEDDLDGFNQDRFQLWNNCDLVEVDVLLLNGAEFILPRNEIIPFAVNLLQDKGIHAFDAAIYALEKDTDTRLALIIEEVGLSLFVEVNYIKYYAIDSMSQAKGWGVNWNTSMGVPYARFKNRESIKITIGVALESFASQYLWVNADACTHRQK